MPLMGLSFEASSRFAVHDNVWELLKQFQGILELHGVRPRNPALNFAAVCAGESVTLVSIPTVYHVP